MNQPVNKMILKIAFVYLSLAAPAWGMGSAPKEPAFEGYDILIVAGQSNAVGVGYGEWKDELAGEAVDSRIDQLGRFGSHAMRPIPMGENLEHWNCAQKGRCGLSFAPTFARRYVATELAPNRRLLLIPAAFGGTASYEWDVELDPGAFPGFRDDRPLLSDLLARIRFSLALPGKNVVRGMLWHQGESDSVCLPAASPCHALTPDVGTYVNRLQVIFAAIRAESNADIPIVLGKFVPGWKSFVSPELKRAIEGGMEQLAERVGRAGVVDTAGLKSNSEEIPGSKDDIHFSAAAQVELGIRYFRMWSSVRAR